jgi:hypothetical protein
MRNRVRALVAACAVAGALSGPGAPGASAATGSLVITGSRTASVIITVPRTVTLDLQRWTATVPTTGTVSASGPYRGFYVQALDKGPSGGSLTASAYRYGSLAGWRVPLAWSAATVQPAADRLVLPRGRYRVYLVTNGTTRMTIPAAGLGATLHMRPTTAATARASLHELVPGSPPPPSGTPRAGAAVEQLALNGPTLTVVAVHVLSHADVEVASVGSYDACLAPLTGDVDCGTRAAMYSNRQTKVVSGTIANSSVTADDLVLVYPPGTYPAGDYVARMQAASAQLVDQSVGFVFTLRV